MKTKKFYIIEHKGNTIDITRDALLMGPLPVLWCNTGMYALIPGAILEEFFEEGGGCLVGTIYWEQAYELPQEVGQLLCDNAYEGENNAKK